jgi:peroxiredoxin Q/BCP
LLADTDGALCNAFGVLYERDVDGEKKVSIQRSTFLADSRGIIRKVWPKVSVAGHAEDVLIALMELQSA